LTVQSGPAASYIKRHFNQYIYINNNNNNNVQLSHMAALWLGTSIVKPPLATAGAA